MIVTIFGLLIPLMGTVLGSAFVVFYAKRDACTFAKSIIRFCFRRYGSSFYMVAYNSIYGYVGRSGPFTNNSSFGWLSYRNSFLIAYRYITPHLHIGSDKPEGPHTKLSRTAMLTFAVTIHNLPEGMAVGVVLAGALQIGSAISTAAAMTMAIGIAIQNIPEGAIISMPMREAGNSRLKSFIIGSLSGIVEPIGGILVILLASTITPALPYLLSFAAGAMFYVVVEELIPEASEGEHSNLSTIGFAIGFALMMTLDVVLG